MPIRQDSPFLLQSSAIGISGWRHGEPIDALPVAALSFAGGRSDHNSRDIKLNDLLSCASATASTHIEYAKGRSPDLSAVATLEGVNVADIVTADRIVARLAGKPNGKGSLPISLIGTRFENLRIAGYPVDVQLALEDRPLNMEGKLVSGSLAQKIRSDGFGIEISDHLISIPGFGTVALADYYAGNGKFDLAMLRVEFQNVPSTELTMGSVSVNAVANGRAERPPRTIASADAERNRVHEPTPEAWTLARSLARKLISADRPEVLRYTKDEREIYLTDVRSDVGKFQNAKHAMSSYGMQFPCLVARGLPGPIPIFLGFENSLFAMARSRPQNWFGPWTYEAYYSVLNLLSTDRRLTLDPDTRIQLLDVETAEKYFSESLERFLAVRFDARQSNISAEPGHLFTVHTDSPHLTIHISPSYAIDPYLSFGDQLSPEVSQYVQPGRWIFGAPELDITDMVDIPPRTATHIRK
jgi:hypothetical protein